MLSDSIALFLSDIDIGIELRFANELRSHYKRPRVPERGVMKLVVSGMLNKRIATELGASEAKMCRRQVMKKMQAKSLPELVRMADKLRPS